MRDSLLDFSTRVELENLANLVGAFRGAAKEIPFFLAGATARDLLLEHAHGINPGRNTQDVDMAVMVPNWARFNSLRSRLIDSGRFVALANVLHKLVFDGFLEVDLIPFGDIERADRTLTWPPDGAFVMNVFGFREVFGATVAVRLPAGEVLRVVSLPALAILKLMAWKARRLTEPGKDANDLAVILRHYLEAGNHERLYSEAAHLLDRVDFDFELAGAWLLGHDMATILPDAAKPRVGAVLKSESDPHGAALLAGDMPIEAAHAMALLQSATNAFIETSGEG